MMEFRIIQHGVTVGLVRHVTIRQEIAFRVNGVMERNGLVAFAVRRDRVHYVERVFLAAHDGLIASCYC